MKKFSELLSEVIGPLSPKAQDTINRIKSRKKIAGKKRVRDHKRVEEGVDWKSQGIPMNDKMFPMHIALIIAGPKWKSEKPESRASKMIKAFKIKHSADMSEFENVVKAQILTQTSGAKRQYIKDVVDAMWDIFD